jgi:hypothetical protein
MATRPRKPGTTTYLLRDVPNALWDALKTKAQQRGTTVRALMLLWAGRYVNGGKP